MIEGTCYFCGELSKVPISKSSHWGIHPRAKLAVHSVDIVLLFSSTVTLLYNPIETTIIKNVRQKPEISGNIIHINHKFSENKISFSLWTHGNCYRLKYYAPVISGEKNTYNMFKMKC